MGQHVNTVEEKVSDKLPIFQFSLLQRMERSEVSNQSPDLNPKENHWRELNIVAQQQPRNLKDME